MKNEENSINETVNHLFRRESGKMVAVLTKIFGTENLHLAEDVVQDALMSALERWKYTGMPDNPRAWLYRVAKNKAIDIIRKNKHSDSIDFSQPDKQLLTSEYTLNNTMDDFWGEDRIKDDFLGMMYACCHPELSFENQVTFILKSLCGFSTKEVARSFLSSEDTISKRIYRTKQFFRKHKIKPEIPDIHQISDRTKAVLESIYLIFNEGYNATHTDQHIREDLITEAISLCQALLQSPKTQLPEVYAMLALLYFNAARLKSRLTQAGELILLPYQDRNLWDKELILRANNLLNEAAFGETISTYHVEAAIAYEHCVAKNFESTNWRNILNYYDMYLSLTDDPVVRLNRCLVIKEVYGANSALDAFVEINSKVVNNYYLYHAVEGDLNREIGHFEHAIRSYKKALKLTQSATEQKLLQDKIAALQN